MSNDVRSNPPPEVLAELRAREARLEGLIHATQDAVVFIDRQAHIRRFNPSAERMFGYREAEVLGEKVNVLMPNPYASQHDDYIARYEQTREPHAIGKIRMVEARRSNGEVFPAELSVTEITVDDEVRYGAFIRDISEKVKLQNELSEKKRLAAVGETAATLAHEVGNPLNNIQLQIQLAERHLTRLGVLDDSLTSALSVVSEEIRRLAELLEEFRMLSRRQQLRLSDTDLKELVFQICAEHQADFDEHRVRIEHYIDKDLPLLRADPAKLRQVLLNLCKNAVEAMPDGGTLTVSLKKSGPDVVITVSDRGGGVPLHLDIFEPFNTTKEHGTGLGLPIARRIVEAHGGALSCAPRHGGGTSFRISLPLAGD